MTGRDKELVQVRITTTCMVDRMIRSTGEIVMMDPDIAAAFGEVISGKQQAKAKAEKPPEKEDADT